MQESEFQVQELVQTIKELRERIEKLEKSRQPILGQNVEITDEGITLKGEAGIILDTGGTIEVGGGITITKDAITMEDGGNTILFIGDI